MVTLAWIELYAISVGEKLYKFLLHKEPPPNFTLQMPLSARFPDLAKQLAAREMSAEFGMFAESSMTDYLNRNSSAKLSDIQIDTLRSCYAAADVVNAPEGGLSIGLTRSAKAEQLAETSGFVSREQARQQAVAIPSRM
jgi:hypothetical protein